MKLPYAEPFRIKMVEEIYPSTREQREEWLKEAHYNLFNLKSSQVFIDLLNEISIFGKSRSVKNYWNSVLIRKVFY